MTSVVPDIEGITFRNALVIDNQPDEVSELVKDLTNRGLSVRLETNFSNAREIIKNRPEINLIIIDWYLSGGNPIESKMILDELKDILFAPVIIYTNHSVDKPNEFIEEKGLKRIAIALDKEKVDGDQIFNELTSWIQKNPELRVYLRWSFEVEKCLNSVLWEIYNLETDGLRNLVEIMNIKEEAPGIPVEYDLIQLYLKVLARKLNHKKDLLDSISKDIKVLVDDQPKITPDPDKIKVFHSFERYITPPVSESIWTGDIIKKPDDQYLIIVTPTCDLCHNKTENVIYIQAKPFSIYRKEQKLGSTSDDKNRVEKIFKNSIVSLHHLPYVIGCPDGLLCQFDQISFMKRKNLNEEISSGNFKRIATIDSPFIENLMQRMNAYLMRLGVRDLEKQGIIKLEEETRFQEN